MADVSQKARNAVDHQANMFRLADARHNLSRSALSTLTGIPESTLKGWARGTTMPAWALGALGEAGVPDELLSLILDPFERHVGTNETGEGDLARLGREAVGFTHALLDAEADGVVTPIERARLKESAGRVAAIARRASA